jgi:hypothetical protein
MNRTILPLAAGMAALLSACVSTPTPKPVSPVDRDPLRREVVADVAASVAQVHDPAGTALAPVRPAAGSFDHALLAALRARGFAIVEDRASGEAFDCTVDSLEGPLYRVVVKVGDTRLSRLWVLEGERAYSGGAWVRGG